MDHQALESILKRKRSNHQYSARFTRWLDPLAHFDTAVQKIAGSNLNGINSPCKNPVELR